MTALKKIPLIAFLAGACFVAGIIGAREVRLVFTHDTAEPRCGLPISDAPDDGLRFIAGGSFQMGAAGIYAEEGPPQEVQVEDFWMSSHDVTNAQFARFVRETGYVTVAERGLDPKDYPGAPSGWLLPGGAVFRMPAQPQSGVPLKWWDYVPGANWRHPEGPASDLRGRENHPVVQVAYEDAAAYARWAGLDLPTEAQWEFAARGGVDGQTFAWGSQLTPAGRPMANTWQGEFPVNNIQTDGFIGTSPVGCFPANGFGLYDMIGNVWQWTRDWYFPDHRVTHIVDKGSVSIAPVDGIQSFDPENPDTPSRVIKGGSFLCSSNYCARYRPAARQPHDAGLGTNHIGFRTIRIVDERNARRS